MIVIEEVSPNAREMRPIPRGWGLIHWLGCAPVYAPMVGVLVVAIVAEGLAGDHLPPLFISGSVIAVGALWMAARWLAQWACGVEARKAPSANLPWRWTITDEGLAFDNRLQSNRTDWRAVKAIRDEHDRFVFLVSPAYNPVLPKRLLDNSQSETLQNLIDAAKASGRLGRGVD